jgi:hypothetical protein
MEQASETFNQRASHFILGTEGQTFGSSYDKQYTPKRNSLGHAGKSSNVFEANNINPQNKQSFSTTNHAVFKDWGQVPKATLNEKKLKELKGHHFHLGSYHPDEVYTSNNYYHNKKLITSDALKNREEGKNKMRAHYHDFKEQNYTNFKSTYNK